jgi:Concanavalin A-like lectin/glucanases superfamily
MPDRRTAALLASLASVSLAAACFNDHSSPPPNGMDQDAGAVFDAETPLDAPAAPDAVNTVEASVDAGSEADATTPIADASPDALADATPDGLADASPDAFAVDAAPDASFESIAALSFDGVDDWVHLPAAPGGASETAFSVELWFRATAATGNMFEVYAGTSADRFLSLNNGQVCFYVYGAPTTQVCTAAATYGDSAWHHAAGTLGSGGVNLYVDGAPAASSKAITASTFTGDTDFRLGMGHTAFVSSIVYFQGALDEVRLWSVERSAADIAANYQQTVSPATAGLQGYWKLDETGAVAVAADSTSGGHDGQLTNFTFTPSPWVHPGAF